MALRLARGFGTTEQFWINLQADYERRIAKAKIAAELEESNRSLRHENKCNERLPEKFLEVISRALPFELGVFGEIQRRIGFFY
jgi:hypothetical protein